MNKPLEYRAGEGVVVTLTVAGNVYTLSDETQARLAHLEAIEEAMRTLDHANMNAGIYGPVVASVEKSTLMLHDLIRNGAQSNG